MKKYLTIVLLCTLPLINSCDDSKNADKELEEQANYIVQKLDSATIKFLNGWNYVQRGKGNIWSRQTDSSFFNCSFFPSIDTPRLSIYQVYEFLTYFRSNFLVDTSYSNIHITKINDTSFSLIGIGSNGQEILLSKSLHLVESFPDQNPFFVLDSLTHLKETLNVIGIHHGQGHYGFIQFYLPGGQHILTYSSDSLLGNTHLNEFWKEELLKGKQITRNWNFRKLENPIDGG